MRGTSVIRVCVIAISIAVPSFAICQSNDVPPAVGERANPTDTFSVMTWNLEWFYDEQTADNYSTLAKQKSSPSREQWDWRRDAVADQIAKYRPTVVAVQEVESRRVLWYLSRAITRNHKQTYREYGIEGRDHYTEQDVGLLVRPPAEVLSVKQASVPNRLRSTNRFANVSKHLITELEFRFGKHSERVTVINVHLISRPEGQPKRMLQARSIQHWISQLAQTNENIILLGDFNTEETGDATRSESELGIAAGLETPSTDDDLIDLSLRIPAAARQTHRLDGRQFDRIFCSRALLEDDPSKPDLVFAEIKVVRQAAIRGRPDPLDQHWDFYWSIPQDERDLSDHFPMLATFVIR